MNDKEERRTMHKYGWRVSKKDWRDLQYSMKPIELPLRIELTETGYMPPVYDQGDLGSCTAQAIAAAIDFERKKQRQEWVVPSRLFIYYNERYMEDSVDYDSGAEIRDGIKSVVKQGVCPEPQWPYIIAKFRERPHDSCYVEALNYQTLLYQKVNNRNLNMVKNVLASGYPVIGGFAVYESFENPLVEETGVVHMPDSSERCLGGHAILITGYNDRIKRFIVRNSWGAYWGKGGYFSMPYDYLTNGDLADDFWTIQRVE